ncbi:MAG: hypothetical protein ACLFUG_02890 [Nitriliruptoraceae bacterium]
MQPRPLTAMIILLLMFAGACAAETDPGDETATPSTDEAQDDAEADTPAAGDATATQTGHPDLPDAWPEDVPIHAAAEELSNVIVDENDDGEVSLIQAQYSLAQPIEDAQAYLEALVTDQGFEGDVGEIEQDGMAEFVEANLTGFGWEVSIAADRPSGSVLYTYSLRPSS